LRIYEFHENPLREGINGIMGINKITFTCVPPNYDILEVKNSLVKSVYHHIMEHTIHNLVSDILFLVSLTSTVFIVSELKKLCERQVEKRHRSVKSDLDFV
jgi:hypothetical protein